MLADGIFFPFSFGNGGVEEMISWRGGDLELSISMLILNDPFCFSLGVVLLVSHACESGSGLVRSLLMCDLCM